MARKLHKKEEQLSVRRKRRKTNMHHEDGEGWAVSYSDMLMVLMSFFIIFFNLDDSPPSHLTGLIEVLRDDSLSFEMKNDVDKVKSEGYVKKGTDSGRGIAAVNKNAEVRGGELGKKLSTFFNPTTKKGESDYPPYKGNGHAGTMPKGIQGGVTYSRIKPKKQKVGKWGSILEKNDNKSEYKGGIVIDFQDNLYRLGGYQLDQKSQKEIQRILKMILPYKDGLNVVFIGHSDSVPLKSAKKTIDSNMILSTMRAAKAVEYAVDNGFDPLWVSSQGLAQNTRNTRSLSIRIMER